MISAKRAITSVVTLVGISRGDMVVKGVKGLPSTAFKDLMDDDGDESDGCLKCFQPDESPELEAKPAADHWQRGVSLFV